MFPVWLELLPDKAAHPSCVMSAAVSYVCNERRVT